MRFASTRGTAPAVGFSEAIVNGIAPDGGLYVPAMFPPVSLDKIVRMADMSYQERAVQVLKLFLEDFDNYIAGRPLQRTIDLSRGY